MSERAQTDELVKLSADERLELIEKLWDSLDVEEDALPTPGWHRSEIDRRLDGLDSGKSLGSSWEDVRRRITGMP